VHAALQLLPLSRKSWIQGFRNRSHSIARMTAAMCWHSSILPSYQPTIPASWQPRILAVNHSSAGSALSLSPF